MDPEAIDLTNAALIAATVDGQTVITGDLSKLMRMTPVDALVVAAWLVRTAQPHTSVSFGALQAAIANG